MTRTVAVLGPGAVGGMLAVRLVRAGCRVLCVAREEAAAAIARDGLALEWQGERLEAAPDGVAQLVEPVDLLLVTVKAPELSDALERIDRAAVGTAVVVPLLNGLEHVDVLRRRLGTRIAVASIGRLEAYRSSRTTIVQTTPLPTVTIATDELPAEDLAVAFDALRAAGVDVQPAASGRAVLWEKISRLAPLAALTSLVQRPIGDIRRDPTLRQQLADAIEEACAVATADGAPVTAESQWEIIDAMPPELTTSTARDIAARRPSELDAIVGAVTRAGRRLDVPTPTLDELLGRLEAG